MPSSDQYAKRQDLLAECDRLAPRWLAHGVMTLDDALRCRAAYTGPFNRAELAWTADRLYRCTDDIEAQLAPWWIFRLWRCRQQYRKAVERLVA